MATLRDTATGDDTTNGVPTTQFQTADQLTWQAGDVLAVHVSLESAASGVSVDTGATTPVFSVACPMLAHSNNDLFEGIFYWIATTAGVAQIRALFSAARTYPHIRAFSVAPAPGKVFQFVGAAPGANGNSVTPDAGGLNATQPGFAVVGVGLYGARNWVPALNWPAIPAEFGTSDKSSNANVRMLAANVGAVNTDMPLQVVGGAVNWVAQGALFAEVDAAGPPSAPRLIGGFW